MAAPPGMRGGAGKMLEPGPDLARQLLKRAVDEVGVAMWIGAIITGLMILGLLLSMLGQSPGKQN